ncbi:unnamed protein product, partial [Closterium sp. NIES-53]
MAAELLSHLALPASPLSLALTALVALLLLRVLLVLHGVGRPHRKRPPGDRLSTLIVLGSGAHIRTPRSPLHMHLFPPPHITVRPHARFPTSLAPQQLVFLLSCSRAAPLLDTILAALHPVLFLSPHTQATAFRTPIQVHPPCFPHTHSCSPCCRAPPTSCTSLPPACFLRLRRCPPPSPYAPPFPRPPPRGPHGGDAVPSGRAGPRALQPALLHRCCHRRHQPAQGAPPGASPRPGSTHFLPFAHLARPAALLPVGVSESRGGAVIPHLSAHHHRRHVARHAACGARQTSTAALQRARHLSANLHRCLHAACELH